MRILLADDHKIVRGGFRRLIESHPGWEVCAEASNGREAIELALALRPEVAVLDLTMPELNGLEATRMIRKELPETEVLIFTQHETDELIHETLAAGARGYVLKTANESQLIAAIEALGRHQPFFTETVSETLVDAFLESSPGRGDNSPYDILTGREREVVQLLAEGKSNKEVAAALAVSVKTAEAHRSAAMHKLGLRSLAQLVRYAVRNLIIEP